MKNTISIWISPKETESIAIPKSWIVIQHARTKKGDKFWHLNMKKFLKIEKMKKVSHFELVIRKRRKAA
jgi:hypothetical protein